MTDFYQQIWEKASENIGPLNDRKQNKGQDNCTLATE